MPPGLVRCWQPRVLQGVDRDDQVCPPPGMRSRQVPVPRAARPGWPGWSRNPAPRGGGPGPACRRWLCGFGPAQPSQAACPCSSVTVTHHVDLGFVARGGGEGRGPATGRPGPARPARRAGPTGRPRCRAGRSGYPAGELARRPAAGPGPGRDLRRERHPGRGARGAVGPVVPVVPVVPVPGGRGGGSPCRGPGSGRRGRAARPCRRPARPCSACARPPADLLVRGQHLVGRQFPAHQGGVAGVLGPPLDPGGPPRLPPFLALCRRDLHHRPGQRGAQPGRGQPPGPARDLRLGLRVSSSSRYWVSRTISSAFPRVTVPSVSAPSVQPAGGQVPRHRQQPVRRGPGLAQRQGQLVPGELVRHPRHLPGLGLEPVLGVTPEHLRDRGQLARRWPEPGPARTSPTSS